MSAVPGRRRLAVPAVLLVLAVALAVAVVALRWDRIRAGSAEPVTGPGAVQTRLTGDSVYDVYADGESAANGGPGTACALNPRDGSRGGVVTLRDDPGDTTELSRDGTRYVYLGSFTSTVDGESVVTCIAASDRMVLAPRGTPYLPLPALLGVLALAAAAVVTLVVALRSRR